ncbi:hypothetical protein C8A03DRAFT_42451 [Achaetomium macrosporum]|uniref:Smr domain-containing protein n=1 Tax=Achaetomium macrosporum TaxID=79813 RepID=A0AAN7CDE3_9PEZI|nr:hypothetical protein C8A03DRAFT_42451 [Achaetomium macrosporum]
MASSAIPLKHLGGHAFNHRTSTDVEAEYDRLRELARSEGDRKKSCFERAHEAYERGDGARAKELSEEGKRHQRQQAEYNKRAAEFIFRENNAPGRVAEDTIDLHGLYVEEAEDILEERIRYARSSGQGHLHVIVGKGNHSTGHVQKLKPRVEQLCEELGLNYATEENEGRIYVDLRGGRVDAPPPLPPQPEGYQRGYGGGRHHAEGGGYHQRPPQHHQQQQPQQEEQDQDILTSCLKSCCLVM